MGLEPLNVFQEALPWFDAIEAERPLYTQSFDSLQMLELGLCVEGAFPEFQFDAALVLELSLSQLASLIRAHAK